MYDFYISPNDYQIAEKNGIPTHLVNNRIRDYGWDKQRAITQPVQKTDLKEWAKIAKQNGIAYNTFCPR